jgi:hypothetical protein
MAVLQPMSPSSVPSQSRPPQLRPATGRDVHLVLEHPWVTAYVFVVVDRDRTHGRTTWDVKVGDCHSSHSHHPPTRHPQSTALMMTATDVNLTSHDGGTRANGGGGGGNEVGGVGSGRGGGGSPSDAFHRRHVATRSGYDIVSNHINSFYLFALVFRFPKLHVGDRGFWARTLVKITQRGRIFSFSLKETQENTFFVEGNLISHL